MINCCQSIVCYFYPIDIIPFLTLLFHLQFSRSWIWTKTNWLFFCLGWSPVQWCVFQWTPSSSPVPPSSSPVPPQFLLAASPVPHWLKPHQYHKKLLESPFIYLYIYYYYSLSLLFFIPFLFYLFLSFSLCVSVCVCARVCAHVCAYVSMFFL